MKVNVAGDINTEEDVKVEVKKRAARTTFMGERCVNPECSLEFKVIKGWKEYRLTCPYCGKRVRSVRILEELSSHEIS